MCKAGFRLTPSSLFGVGQDGETAEEFHQVNYKNIIDVKTVSYFVCDTDMYAEERGIILRPNTYVTLCSSTLAHELSSHSNIFLISFLWW